MKDTENTGQELLPCPFCGSAPEVLENAAAGISAYVRCGCQSHIFETRDLAIKNWNRRAPEAPVPQPDALRNAAQSALDLLEYVKKAPSDAGFIDWRAAEVEKELRAALSGDAAAPQPAAQERASVHQQLEDLKAKVARIGLDTDRAMRGDVNEQSPIAGRLRMIAAEQVRKPLTAAHIEALPVWRHFIGLLPDARLEITRSIERAHGITGEA